MNESAPAELPERTFQDEEEGKPILKGDYLDDLPLKGLVFVNACNIEMAMDDKALLVAEVLSRDECHDGRNQGASDQLGCCKGVFDEDGAEGAVIPVYFGRVGSSYLF